MSHARLGHLARWVCPGCFAQQRPGSYPCMRCCGYTGRRSKVYPDARNAFGKPTKKVPS